MRRLVALLLPVALITHATTALPCTNFIATPGATADGSVMVTYTCDGEFHPTLRYLPGEFHNKGAQQDIKNWSGDVMGQVTLPAQTYAVVNLMNEKQVTIAETTTGGREELVNPDGLLHYWTLMRLVLQRAATAREAVQIMGDLVAEYGYRSSGESYYIGDPHEAWVVEMVGPGPGGRGAHWVALKVPDGYVCAHANLGRIDAFDRRDKDNCLASKGMEKFAESNGWYNAATDGKFSWRKAFHPTTAQNLRYTETRVWSLYRRCAPSQEWPMDHHRGNPDAEPLPLWIKPDQKLAVADVFELMRDHYEGTPLDMTQGVDAGPYGSPYRWRPMGFAVDGEQYTWERPISTQQTGFSMVCQSRAWLPDPVGGVTWYGLDDTDFTCYVPLYCSITDIPRSYRTGGIRQFSWDSAWWVFNFVSNYAALRYDEMIEDVRATQAELEGYLLDLQPAVEQTAASLHATDPDLCRRYLTDYSLQHAEDVVDQWRRLGEHLLTRYNDGYIKNDEGQPQEVGYPEAWLRMVVEQRPDQFRLPVEGPALEEPEDY